MSEEKRETRIDRMMSAKGDEIRAAREKLGISQAELASRSGTNQQTIDRLERGLTRQSKFMPEIREALGLPPYQEPEESLPRFSARYESGFGVRAHIAEDYRDPDKVPVFSMSDREGLWVVDENPKVYLPRTYPVADALNAYGIIVPDDKMAPALRKGEVAIVDPDASADYASEVFLIHGLADGRIAGLLRNWVGFEHYKSSVERGGAEQHVKVRTFNPPEVILLRWLTWPAMGAVVAKLPMPRN
jgi:transcriptional regulator with XRE-family HTH domain